jgi:predicted O-methyltransferase YrrM
MSLAQFLASRGKHISEGYSQQVPQQMADLIKLTSSPNISVMEIGFNAGHSAEVFLKNNPSLTLTSFDLGYHDYVKIGKEYIDITYPNRHTLLLGDSTITVPTYIQKNVGKKFDVLFIDGGHDYHIANLDMKNCMKLAHKDSIVILDDTIYRSDWVAHYTVGPTKVWSEHVTQGLVTEMKRVDYRKGRGMSWGKYTL